jgi:uncharacterized caspase-like protein
MPKSDHYAIVVGLSSYPGLAQPPEPPADLKGPGNDADAVADWLKSPTGGDLPPENVKVIKSPGVAASAADAEPSRDEIEKAFVWLEDIATENRKRNQWRVGRRLYVYMSGHGFSPRRNHGCLFAANATTRFGYHVYPSSWLEWFQDAEYFSEFVLWMDCCMNRMSTLPPSVAPAQPLNKPAAAGPTFIAFAAQRPLKAVERAIAEDGGQFHGVFTWTLLQGLQGAAADGFGMVTGRSLADWLRNAQRSRMDKRDLDDPDVAEEPEISREDSGIIFARGLAPKTYPVRLSFPAAAVGSEAKLWAGRPPRVDSVFQIDASAKELALRPALYVLSVPAAGLRHGFEVTGGTTVAVSGTGDPIAVERASEMFDLDISPSDSPTEIFVIDERFGLVDRAAGKLQARLPFGIYKVKTRLGRNVDERIILLDRGVAPVRQEALQIASAAPLPNTTLSHEYQFRAATDAMANVDRNLGTGARLVVMARAWSETGQARVETPPWEGVTLVTARGKIIADLSEHGQRHSQGDPFAVCSLSVAPGAYFLRQRLQDGRDIEQSVIVPEGWFVHLYLLRLADPDSAGFKARPRVSVIMHRADQSFAFSDRLLTTLEVARVAVADERKILNEELEALLLREFDNPVAGVLGGHLLLIEKERDPARDIRILDQVVTKLRALVGSEHPDVECLSLHCPDESLRRSKPIRSPPMLQRSWTLLVEASHERRSLIPAALWDRVQANSSLPPYLVWAPDDDSKAASRAAIARTAIDIAGPDLRLAMPERALPERATPERAMSAEATIALAGRGASTRQIQSLSKRFRAATMQNASRLQVPPSALAEIGKDIISKLKS